jgi:hypothetical protein
VPYLPDKILSDLLALLYHMIVDNVNSIWYATDRASDEPIRGIFGEIHRQKGTKESSMTTILIVVAVYVLGAIFIGIPMGKKSLAVWKTAGKVYRRGKTSAGLWGFILFPMMASEGEVGVDYPKPFGLQLCWSDLDDNENAYVAMTAMFWPTRIAFTAISMLVVALMTGLAAVFMFFFEILPEVFGNIIKAVSPCK